MLSSQAYSGEFNVKLTLLSNAEQGQIRDKKLRFYTKEIEMIKSRIPQCGDDSSCIDHFENILRKEELSFSEAKSDLEMSDIWRHGVTTTLIQNEILKSNDFDLTYSCTSDYPRHAVFIFSKLDLQSRFHKTNRVQCRGFSDDVALCEYYEEDARNSIYIKDNGNLIGIIGELSYLESLALIEAWNNSEEANKKQEKLLSSIQVLDGNVIYYPFGDECEGSQAMYSYKLLGESLLNPKLGSFIKSPTK
ncbi:MAG: hypothetical protein HRT54_24225 [Colwellia sp.]|nr:hypothetical protein [Colwellia sp.]